MAPLDMEPENQMDDELEGQCHCGGLRWTFHGKPQHATICNCTLCRRYGVIWAYGNEASEIEVKGRNMAYIRGDETLGFHFCPDCGCVAYWRALAPEEDGGRRMAVNLRMAAPDDVAGLRVQFRDGLDNFQALPRDGRCIADIWV